MIQLSIENRVATLTLNRPEKRNALNDEMASALLENLRVLAVHPDCKVLVIKGSGEAFCAGADLAYLKKLQNNSYEENLADSTALMEMFRALYEFPKISIAQVEGPAFAGGCGLAGLCDFCFATPGAGFAYTEVKIGFIPAIVSVFLAPRIGENNARRMLLTGDVFTAAEAKQMGLVSEIVESDLIEKAVLDFALKLCRSVSGNSVAATKALIQQISGKPIAEQLQVAAAANAAVRGSADCKQGIQAFLNKQPLQW